MSSKKRRFDNGDYSLDEPKAKKRRSNTSSSNRKKDKSSCISYSKPFKHEEDNKEYLSIVKTLKKICWNSNKKNFNSKYPLSPYQLILSTIPSTILQLIAEYSTGKIYQCTVCDKSEVLIMHDKSMYSSDDKSAPIICANDDCNGVIFCCNKNECPRCDKYFCDYCMGECCQIPEHPCCVECLLTCGLCYAYLEHGGICYSCCNYSLEICDGCNHCYCYECVVFSRCRKCQNSFCSQCHPDWYCANATDCQSFVCMDCNKNGMDKCKECKKTYCQDCVETCIKCGKYYCDNCKKSSDKMCTRCIKKSKKKKSK